MTKTELDKMLEDARLLDEWPMVGEIGPWLTADELVHRGIGYRRATHIANCSPGNIKWMGERIKELEAGLAEAYKEIRRVNGTPAAN